MQVSARATGAKSPYVLMGFLIFHWNQIFAQSQQNWTQVNKPRISLDR